MSYTSSLKEPSLPSFVDTRPIGRKLFWSSAALISLIYFLLWSPWWYPLSDSALYLSIGRSIADGDGFQFLGETHRLAAPLTPLLIATVFRLDGGIGVLHFIMVTLMLLGFLFSYLTLAQWFGQRPAVAATLAGAFSFWVARCATTIMTEPLGFALFWIMMWTISKVVHNQNKLQRHILIGSAIFLFILSLENRAAMVLLLPGTLVALWILGSRVASRQERIVWLCALSIAAGITFWDYRYGGNVLSAISYASAKLKSEPIPKEVNTLVNIPAEVRASGRSKKEASTNNKPKTTNSNVNSVSADTNEERFTRHNSAYHFAIPDTQSMLSYPYHFGRWICEGLMAPTVTFFKTSHPILSAFGVVLSLAAIALASLGTGIMLTHRQWWILGPITYCLPIWLLWSARIISRYMVPFTPVLFLLLWYAVTYLIIRLQTGASKRNESSKRVGLMVMVALLAVTVFGNLPPLAMEIYLRHAPDTGFYDVARRGATKELFVISDYIQQHSSPQEVVGTNGEHFHRVIHYLTNRHVKGINTRRLGIKRSMQRSNCRFVVAFSREDAPWPDWHWPLPTKESPQSWWQLYERNDEGHYEPVHLPIVRLAATAEGKTY